VIHVLLYKSHHISHLIYLIVLSILHHYIKALHNRKSYIPLQSFPERVPFWELQCYNVKSDLEKEINMQTIKQQWFGNIRGDILSGIVVALALIPEAIAFSIIAGVDPMVGLYASFIIAVVIAFAGGRPGMISAATGAMALLMVPLVRDYGLDYLLAATILTGVIQILFGIFKVAKVMKFIPNAVM